MSAEARPSLSRNTLAQASPQLLAYTFSFLSAPIVLHGLGLRNFGIWALTGALAQYGGLLDLGVGRTLSYFAALHETSSDRRALGRCFSIGALIVPSVVGALIPVCWFAGGPLAHDLGQISIAHMRFLLFASLLMLGASMTTSFLAAYAIGMRAMVVPNIALSIATACNFVFSVAAVLIRPNLFFYAGANAAASVVGVATVLAAVAWKRMLPPLSRPDRSTARAVVSYSIRNQVVWLSTLINFQSDKIVIAIFVGPRAAGAYELANRVAAAARSAGILAVSAMVPTLTARFVRDGVAALRADYQRLTQRTTALSVPWLFLSAALAPSLLGAWLGQSPAWAPTILAILSLAYVANAITATSYVFASATGRPGLPARAAMATAAANAAITATLAPVFGTVGVLVGTFVALSGGAAYQLWLVHRDLEIRYRQFVAAVRAPVAVAAALAVPVAIAALWAAAHGRVAEVSTCLGAAVLYVAAYLGICARRQLLPTAVARLIPVSAPVRLQANRHK